MDAERAAERDFVVRTAQENDVKFIRLWFSDILGSLKGFAITVEDLEDAIEQGVGFDGAAIEGFARIDESDMRAFPDPTTFTILPWRPRQNAVARMFCDIRTPSREPFIGDPRYALKRNLERLASSGYTYYVGPELEFFYLKDSKTPEPLDQQGYYDQVSSYPAGDLRRDTVLNLADMGIPVKYSHHEGAHSQHEIDLQYTDALTMADNVMTAKLVIKELAQLKSAYATFMPKPISGMNGSGMHIHQSLFQGDKNIFFDSDDEHQLSIQGKRFIAGLLHHAPEITVVTNQWVNSYKRLVPGFEAPAFISWAHTSRTAIMDANGLTSVSYTYQWIRVATDNTETNIAAATASTYTLVAADQGTTIKVTVSFTDDANNPETRTSAATAAVSAAANTPATGAPTITGTAQVGQTLTAGTTAIMDANGLTSVSYTYQWIRVATDNTETNIAAATASTYTLVAADQGTTVKVGVSFTDDASNAETRTSAATATVSAAAVSAAVTGTPEPEPVPVPALPLLGQLLLALGLAGAGAMRLVRSARRP